MIEKRDRHDIYIYRINYCTCIILLLYTNVIGYCLLEWTIVFTRQHMLV